MVNRRWHGIRDAVCCFIQTGGYKCAIFAVTVLAVCLLMHSFLFLAVAKEGTPEDTGTDMNTLNGISMASLPIEETRIDGGDITDTISWSITEDDAGIRTLRIMGTGAMPDYQNENGQPWRTYADSIQRLRVEDGITAIGTHCFNRMKFSRVYIGNTVEFIGSFSFAYGHNLAQITIPGNVKKVDKQAFVYHYALEEIYLEEGIEEIGNDAFASQKAAAVPIHLPASLKKLGEMPFWNVSEYTVAEENTEYVAVDGILYTKDMTVLKDFPKKKAAAVYRIPDSVTEIGASALSKVQMAKKLYIPDSVQTMQKSYMTSRSSWEEIYIEDGVPLSCNGTFYSNAKLTTVRLPENTALEEISHTVGYGCTSLTSFKIPNGTKKVSMIGSPLTSLETLIYDAQDAVLSNKAMIDTAITYQLVIGHNVDVLPSEFQWFAGQAKALRFETGNALLIEEGALRGSGSPFADMQGTYYIDEQGIVYHYDEITKEAAIVYFQGGSTRIMIPEYITPENGISCKVNVLNDKVFRGDPDLLEVEFEAPEKIEKMGSYAFSDCPSLKRVNQQETLDVVLALFTGVDEPGYHIFYNTGLKGALGTGSFESEMSGGRQLAIQKEGTSDLLLSVRSDGSTMEWQGEEKGGYRLLTGDTMTVFISTGNTNGTEEYVYRVYLQRTGEQGTFSVSPGKTYSYDGQEAVCYGTEDENTIYLDFIPQIGKSISIPVTAVYPSPESSGGGVTIWGEILDKEEAGSLVRPENKKEVIQAFWTTKADTFRIVKKGTGKEKITLKGTSAGNVAPESSLEWQISFERAEAAAAVYGKDYVTSVDFKDVLQLPAGMLWQEEIIKAIKDGEIRRSGNDFYAGNIRIAALRFTGGSMNLTRVGFTLNEETEQPVLIWSLVNKTDRAEMNSAQMYLTFYPEAFYADMKVFDLSDSTVVLNHAEAIVHYHYAEASELVSNASKGVTAGSGSLSLSKTSTKEAVYFGEEIMYTIRLSNPGAYSYQASGEGIWMLEDVMDSYTYLEPDDMASLLKEQENLTIQIRGADLAPWEQRPGIWKDSFAWKNGFNSGKNEKDTATDCITINWRSETKDYYVLVGEDGYAGNDLGELLVTAGYEVTHWAQYVLLWEMNEPDEAFLLKPGEERTFTIRSRVKNTFAMLTRDEENDYPIEEPIQIKNYVYLKDQNNKNQKQTSVGNSVKREAYLTQTVWTEGRKLSDGFVVEEGSILTYEPELKHYGTGRYENLPMVDEIYGAQALLVSVDKNPQLASMGLPVCEAEGEIYYVLTEGHYHNVIAGTADDGADCLAYEVQVEKEEEPVLVEFDGKEIRYSGFHTTIRWYYPKLEGGSYYLNVRFHTKVDQKLAGTNAYTLANTVWMNDRELSRLYSVVYGGGSIIDFDKEILKTRGAEPAKDLVIREDYSMIHAGETVTYRLTLRPKGEGTYRVEGEDLADRLPGNGEVFQWIKGVNVNMKAVSTHESTKMNGMDSWQVSDSWEDMEEAGQQYLIWDDTMSITFHDSQAAVYLYVELTYPEHDGTGESTWSRYAKELAGTGLTNTFYVYQYPARVSHHLYEEGQVLLQKGVSGMQYAVTDGYGDSESRLYYNNKDNKARYILYYVLLYNGGNKKMYLDDLYDRLPDGFTYEKLTTDQKIKAGTRDEIQTLSEFPEHSFVDASLFSENGLPPQYKNARVQLVSNEDSVLRLRLSPGEGEHPLSYDEEKRSCYLDRDEAVLFGYVCAIGNPSETEERPCNRIAMAYKDYLNSGVVTDFPDIRFYGAEDGIHVDQNDGDCQTADLQYIKDLFPNLPDSEEDVWLLSEVSVHKGKSIPGVTKYTDSYQIPGNDQKIEYLHSVSPYDTVNYRVRLHNGGTLSLTDYTFVDRMPDPYVFTGDVTCTLYDYQDTVLDTFVIASIGAYKKSDETVEVKNNGNTITHARDGSWTSLVHLHSAKANLSLTGGKDGEEILKLHFFDPGLAIPEGGYMDIALSAKNPTTTYKNTVYTNQALLIPNGQKIETVSHGSLTVWEELDAVTNSAPVTVSFGYSTSSSKRVEGEDGASVSGTEEKNYIVLPSADHTFTYCLTVSNDTEKSMEKLVIIDPLPEPGDSSPFQENAARNSAFTVQLLENPDVRVKITTKDGEVYELDKSLYQVDYKEERLISETDWSGTEDWKETQKKRVLRVRILDQTGDLIPAKAKVEVIFDAKADEQAKAGEIAVNSFGYHYKLKDVEEELEAMPLPVGVKVQENPALIKKLIHSSKEAAEAEKDEQFRFYLYEGDAIKEEGFSEEEFLQELKNQDRTYQRYELTVRKGEFCSEELCLSDWNWKQGKTYTITELEQDSDSSFSDFNGISKRHYSFVYEPDQRQTIVCQNIIPDWKLSVQKVDRKNPEKGLSEAVFALYGREAETDKVPEGIEPVVMAEGQNWYFCKSAVSDEKGMMEWNRLKQKEYYLLEVKAPEGYECPKDGWIIDKENAKEGVLELKIENQKGFRLLKTGGNGTEQYFMMGICLLLLAGFLRYKYRKEKGV